MELNKIHEEQSNEIVHEDSNKNASASFTCQICQNAITDNREVTELSDANISLENIEVIDNKKKELDSIQTDLNNLMDNLNTFIADNLDECDSEEIYSDDDDGDTEEKQDGPQEKELKMMEKYQDYIYSSDGVNPPEVNWTLLAPILQKHVEDLKRLHNLNTLTTSVMKRIKNITQLNEALKELEESEEK